MTKTDEVKNKLFDDLESVISATSRTDKLIILGDFNARMGTKQETEVLGVPQSQSAAYPRHKEEEETEKPNKRKSIKHTTTSKISYLLFPKRGNRIAEKD